MYLTAVVTEDQISGFADFLKGLTWETVIPAAISLVVSLIVIKILTSLFNKAIKRSKIEPTLHSMISVTFKIVLYVIALLIVTGTLGMDVSILVAVFSIVSLAISLAVQGTLANVAGGLTILTSKPFHVEDYVEIGGTGGTVQRIGLTYTDLRTPDNQDVHVPNSQVISSTIVNYTASGSRRISLTVNVSYDAPTEDVKEALLAACRVEGTLEDPAPEAYLFAYGDSSIQYVLRAWTSAENYWAVHFAVLEKIRSEFAERGIPMTYNHLNIHMMQ